MNALLDNMKQLDWVEDAPSVASCPSELEIILAAWQEATDRLQRTHEVLAAEVQRLTHELEVKNRELARKNRLADLGQMASHVAHEVRNGLSPVTLYLSWLRRRCSADADALRILDKLEAGCTDVEATVSDMLSFAADREPIWRRFGLRDLVTELRETLAPQFAAHQINVVIDIEPSWSVWADRDQVRRVLINWMLNAVDVLKDGGEITVAARERDGGFELDVCDTGPGIPEEALPRVFEPFFTTKSEGSGLGLAIVERIATAHGGEAIARNRPTGGAWFTLRIPSYASAANETTECRLSLREST